MALRVLMTMKNLDQKNNELEEIRNQLEGFKTREIDLEKAIEEATSDEEKKVVEEEVEKFEKEKAELEQKENELDAEVTKLEGELAELEKEQETPEVENEEPQVENEKRKVNVSMETRQFFKMNAHERDMFFDREDVKDYLGEVRSAIREKRALTNVGLTIPEVFLGLIRENLIDYSKLYKHVDVRRLSGNGRFVIQGDYDEAIWTECCANLNELALTWYDLSLDCYKLGGFYEICNATLEDSNIDLASELITAISKAIGKALDKAILYGDANKKPEGVLFSLAQTSEPADYPVTARPWVDLHTSNIISIPAGTTGAALIAAIAEAFGNAKSHYSRGSKVWTMNETTYTKLVASTVSVDASGAIVAGVNGTMPVLGGVIEVLNFIPDNVIIAGYFDNYVLAERAGQKFMTSEHVKFLEDKTVFKGTSRWDGKPAIREAYVAIGLEGVTPDATMTFAPDNANTGA